MRSELARLQTDFGLTLASYESGLEILSFKGRSLDRQRSLPGAEGIGALPRDGTELALQITQGIPFLRIVRLDGSDGRDFDEIGLPLEMCWSYDKSKLALVVQKTRPDSSLIILDLRSKSIKEIDRRAHVQSQCWSPDDKRIAYDADNTVRIYEIGKDQSNTRVIAKGKRATWSSDGQWIAFLDEGTYYAIRPTESQGRVLFQEKNGVSGLWWSPDSRIVAYVSRPRIIEGGFLPWEAENYRLRVRRLEDSSEDWVADGISGGSSFQWVANKDLLKNTESVPSPK
ncbi:MAG: hypothetical protein WCD43_11685 [Candidatus Acidiferrales bacterium]